MQGLIIILIFWVISRVMKDAKKTAKMAPKKTDMPTAQQMRAEIERRVQEASGSMTPQASGAPMPIPPLAYEEMDEEEEMEECPDDFSSHEHGEGFSHYDAEGCVGGSLEHSHEGPGNLAAQREEPSEAPVSAPQSRRSYGAQQLRQAIITSEILRAPVALRGRTARR